MLLINNLSKSFGGITALKNLDLKVNTGEVVGLIGQMVQEKLQLSI